MPVLAEVRSRLPRRSAGAADSTGGQVQDRLERARLGGGQPGRGRGRGRPARGARGPRELRQGGTRFRPARVTQRAPRVRPRSGWRRRAAPGSGAARAPRTTTRLARPTSCGAIRRAASYIACSASTARPSSRASSTHTEVGPCRPTSSASCVPRSRAANSRVVSGACAARAARWTTWSRSRARGAGSARLAAAGAWPRSPRTSRAT